MEKELQEIELILDEKRGLDGVYAMSVVSDPAMEEWFVKMSKHPQVMLKQLDEEKRIICGPALIPEKRIYRRDEKLGEYKIYFSAETIRRGAEIFLEKARQAEATIEHESDVDGLVVVESWIVDNKEMDKSTHLGFDVPNGTWMITMKCHNGEVWDKIKAGEVNGFSIEGRFADRMMLHKQHAEMSTDSDEDEVTIQQLKELFKKYYDGKKKNRK
jgi:hypothetical protein